MVSSRLKWTAKMELKLEDRTVLDDEGFRILEAIKRRGSIALAGKAMGRSYAYVWRYVRKASGQLGYPLVETRIGGSTYGGATVTKDANKLMDRYNELLSAQRYAITDRMEASKKVVDLVVTGSDCPGLKLILELMLDQAGITSELNTVGSAAGLAVMMLGEADMTGLHLLDRETGQYNIPFLRRFWLDDRTNLVRGYVREQGLIVRRGNPKKITGLDDMTRRDIRLVNRQRGSGTRVLLEHVLWQLSERRSISVSKLTTQIRGYENEVRSHGEVMEQIIIGKADLGLGIKPTSNDFDFIPIHDEFFDFAIDRQKMSDPKVNVFRKLLSSRKFKEALAIRAPGLRTTPESGKTVYP